MVIYIDVLIILNFFINFLIVICASAFIKKPVSRVRIFLSSLLGGFFALVLLLPDFGRLFSVLLKLIGALIMTLTAFGFGTVKMFFKSLFGVCLVSFSFAGIFLGIYLVFRPEKMTVNNGEVYFDISVRFFVVCAVACYLFIKLVIYLIKRNTSDNTLCVLTLEMNSKSAVLKGLVDTGNSLTDVFTNKPVTTVEKRAVKRILPENLPEERQGVVPVKTALGSGILPLVRFDRMTIVFEKRKYEIISPLIALSDSDLSDGEYQALVNEQIFEFGSKKNETVKDYK